VRARIAILLALSASALVVSSPAAEAAPAPPRPNILMIVTDDQPLGTLSVMPATRKLFRRGGRTYPNAYATTPLCCPSRASILTGRYAHNHGILTQEPQSFDVRATIPRYLQRAGYLTGIAGKYLNRWGALPDYRPMSPPYFDLWATTRPNAYYGATFNINGRLLRMPGHSTRVIHEKTIEFLKRFERRDRRPWFMYTATAAPHLPARAGRRYRNARVSSWSGNPAVFELDRSDKPAHVRRQSTSFERARDIRTRQLRSLMSVDDMVEAIFAQLRRTGESRNTLAVFVSDNGFLWGEHGIANKTVPYLRSVKVPLLLRWPARVRARTIDRRMVANVDLTPTVAHVARLNVGHTLDGRSLLDRRWTRDHLLLEYFEGDTAITPTWASVTSLVDQFVQYYDEDGDPTEREYYDLIHDPWQLVNTLGDFDPTNDPSPAKIAELAARLADDRACAGSSCP
jgi:arylsulfatase A-like enzyme